MAGIPFLQAANAYSAISKIGNASSAEQTTSATQEAPSAAGGTESFGDLVSAALSKARDSLYKTESMSVDAVANKAQLHELVAAVANTEVTLQAVVAVRDKMINAYQDILKMPI